MAEREQGITIDVAYRFFATQERSFIVADCPGHEQYTRNMAVGASFADAAVILTDVSQGLLLQTKRHTRICALMGIKHIILAVNKIDLVDYDKHVFEDISRCFKRFAVEFDFKSITIIPVSATEGDNIIELSKRTLWYEGQPLLLYLESLDTNDDSLNKNFIMPVQRVCRPSRDFRGFQGQIDCGELSVGDEISTLPGNERAGVSEIYVNDRCESIAVAGQAVTLCLDREVDISRGCVLVKENTVQFADQFRCVALWMDETAMMQGRNYIIKCGTKELPANIIRIHHKIDIDTGNYLKASRIHKNELVACDIALSQGMVFDSFKKNKTLGRFILIDRVTNHTAACGVIEHSLRRSTNVVWQKTDISRDIRAEQKNQKPFTIWLTGLSGSGKSVLSNELEKRLVAMGKHTMLLDGDNVRHGLCRDLGFVEGDRIENIRRVAEVAKLMNDAGLIAITAFISPYLQDRENAKGIIGSDNFVEVYVSTPLEVCEQRDAKGLYKKARNGEIPQFTGISSPYEEPVSPDLEIDTSDCSVGEAVDRVLEALERFESAI
jgi:bifunctional enzyme CysN/CysC